MKSPIPKPFQYKVPKQRKQVVDDPPTLDGDTDREALSGFVHGDTASDLEERFARALDKDPTVQHYTFQPSYIENRNIQGEIRLDFMVYAGLQIPVQIDGEFTHKSAGQRQEDLVKDAMLNDYLNRIGAYQPVVRIPGMWLQDQDSADTTEQMVVSGGKAQF